MVTNQNRIRSLKSYPVEFSHEAREDTLKASAWYESKSKGLGAAFATRIDESISRISNSPLGAPEVHRGVRRVVMRQFRNLIFYRIEASRVIVIGCRHERENPDEWPS